MRIGSTFPVLIVLVAGCGSGDGQATSGAASLARELLDAVIEIEPGFMLGGPAPEVALRELPVEHGTDEVGALVRLSDVQGDVVVLDFWNTGCRPCIAEHATLNELAESYRDRGVRFFGVSEFDTSASLARFADEHGPFVYPNLSDRPGDGKRAFRVRGWPTKVVIDRTGTVVWWRPGGPIEREVLAGVIEDALAGRRPTAETSAVYPTEGGE